MNSKADYPSILSMSGPLIVSFWMRAVVTFVDTVYASLLGDTAVAAIGLTIPFDFLMIAIWVGLSTGLTSALSRAMGAREGAKVEQYIRSGWKLVGIVSPLFTVVGAGIWFVSPYVNLEPDVIRMFQIYGTVLIAGSAFTTFWSIIPDSLIKAHQDTRTTMWAGIWTNLVNVALNTLFLFVFDWGIFGIALSTVLGRIAGLWYAIVRARFHEARRKREMADTSKALDPAPDKVILGLAVPSSMTFMLMALETAVINGFLAAMEHATEAIATYSIYYRVVLFALQPIIAIAVAMLPYAAKRLGESDLSGIKRGLREAIVATSLYSLVIVGPILVFGAPYIADSLTESVLTRQYTTFALRTVPLSCLFGSLFLLCRPVFEAFNRGRPGLALAILRYVILTAPLAWLGLIVADRTGYPSLYGLIVGLLVAAGISSGVFFLWLRAMLNEAEIAGAIPRATTPS